MKTILMLILMMGSLAMLTGCGCGDDLMCGSGATYVTRVSSCNTCVSACQTCGNSCGACGSSVGYSSYTYGGWY